MEKPQPGGTIYLPGGNPYGFDPARDFEFTFSVLVMDRIYSPVYRYENDPSNLADSVLSDSVGKVWTIYLKKNLRFQDDPCFKNGLGAEIKASDVKFSYERAKGPPFLVAPIVKQIQKIDILDSHRLSITLNNPNLNFKSYLGSEDFFIVSEQAVEYYGNDYRHHPVSSGPFRLAELNPGETILVKNENFWAEDSFGQSLPYLDKIIFKYDPDPVSQYRKLISGDFDIITLGQINSPPVVKFDKEKLSFELIDSIKNQGIKLVEGTIVSLLHCPLDRRFRTNPLVGQALNWAIDREKIQRKGLCTLGVPAGGPLFKTLNPGIEKYGFDPDRARSLLTKAGYPGGVGFPTLVFSTHPGSVPIFRSIQQDLAAINIKTDLIIESQLQSFAHEDSFSTQFIINTARDDPLDQLIPYQSTYYLFLRESKIETAFDSLYQLAEREPLKDRQIDLIRKMEAMVLKEPPAIFLFWYQSFYLMQDYVMDINPERFGVYEKTWIKR